MRKITSLFQRNYDGDRLVRNEVVPGSEWVLSGEGVPTRKWDGTCCMVRGGKLFKRHEVKKGKSAPADFEAAGEVDLETGKQQGWRPVGDGPEDQWHREAYPVIGLADGTYELCGPKIQENPERLFEHVFIPHGTLELRDCDRTFDAIREFLRSGEEEGIVWHHPDGRMAKIKGKDFGFKRA